MKQTLKQTLEEKKDYQRKLLGRKRREHSRKLVKNQNRARKKNRKQGMNWVEESKTEKKEKERKKVGGVSRK